MTSLLCCAVKVYLQQHGVNNDLVYEIKEQDLYMQQDK